MTEPTSRISVADLRQENRQLKKAVKELLDALEDQQGQTPPGLSKARDELPDVVGDSEQVGPPWEREGISKQEWLSRRRDGPNTGDGDNETDGSGPPGRGQPPEE